MTYCIELPRIGTAIAWRNAARALASNDVPPEGVTWNIEGAPRGLFDASAALPTPKSFTTARGFVSLAHSVVWHTDPKRFGLLYALLWRLQTSPRLISDRADPALARLRQMEKTVHRCQHKMKAFVRFREIPSTTSRRSFAAWFEPTHHTVEPTAEFFRRRFADMDWCIVSPDVTARCVNGKLSFTLDEKRPDLPPDANEALWTTYYCNIFNPARLKVNAMTSEMPKKYWKNLPEAAAIPDLIASAERRVKEMALAAPTVAPAHVENVRAQVGRLASPWQSDGSDLVSDLNACTRCQLHQAATQAVPGEGPFDARVMIVGEQPGDQEDLAGRPFVGPAGQLFDQIAQDVGLDRTQCFVTNAVKHFKYTPRGKRRIHQRPNSSEISRCRWWLDAEIAKGTPDLIVAMGAVAAEALTGSGSNLLKRCGQFETVPNRPPILITIHPSFALRAQDASQKAAAIVHLKRDLATAARYVNRSQRTNQPGDALCETAELSPNANR